MIDIFIKIFSQIEQFPRIFYESIKTKLGDLRIFDITPEEAFILYRLGERKLNISKLRDLSVYNGTNATYIINKMKRNGYIIQENCEFDKRASSLLSLSPKGLQLFNQLHIYLEKKIQQNMPQDFSKQTLEKLSKELRELEKISLSSYKL